MNLFEKDLDLKKVMIVLVGLAIILGALIYFQSDSGLDCERQYDKALDGNISAEEIPDECRPVPEDVEDELLVQAFGS